MGDKKLQFALALVDRLASERDIVWRKEIVSGFKNLVVKNGLVVHNQTQFSSLFGAMCDLVVCYDENNTSMSTVQKLTPLVFESIKNVILSGVETQVIFLMNTERFFVMITRVLFGPEYQLAN